MGDIEAGRALNYKGEIFLYQFSRAPIMRSAELVQRNYCFVIERSGHVYIAHQLFFPRRQKRKLMEIHVILEK